MIFYTDESRMFILTENVNQINFLPDRVKRNVVGRLLTRRLPQWKKTAYNQTRCDMTCHFSIKLASLPINIITIVSVFDLTRLT